MKTSPIQTFQWEAPVTSLKGISEAIAQKLAKLNLYTLGDLLLHFPFRYEDHTHITSMRDLREDNHALIEGNIQSVVLLGKKKKRYVLTLGDTSGVCEIVFFHSFASQRMQWQPHARLRCFGQVKRSAKGFFQLVHPDWECLTEKNVPLPPYLTAFYPTVAGLAQKALRKWIRLALDHFLADPLSEALSWKEGVKLIHCPTPDLNIDALMQREHPAYQQLAREELVAHHFTLQKFREGRQGQQAASLTISEEALNTFLKRLPFELTSSQKEAWEMIRHDLAQNKPMLRLLQGDVGCGKTIVAALAALVAVKSGKQVAMMVPTEILAEQHFTHFTQWFEDLSIRCSRLTGKLSAKERRQGAENIALGLTHIIIGTHALFQEGLHYPDLGLVIIDEQHRFGVHQRLALRDKGVPHQLIMTATPIPRTLAMSHYAHLDLSTISTLPPGRKPVKTIAIPHMRRAEVIEKIKKVCEQQQQVYWVCTLIAESEQLECQAAEVTYASLCAALSAQKIGLVHGKLESTQKEWIMQQFYQGEIDILVATTVIEVGVNVPNATLMVIENPERLGLAQLHQLRGRVGRGEQASFCLLLYQSPLSPMAQARLGILRDSNDGFVIAEADLQLRGPGEILGTKQTGERQFKVVDLKRDQDLIHSLPEWIASFYELSPEAIQTIITRWVRRVDYVSA